MWRSRRLLTRNRWSPLVALQDEQSTSPRRFKTTRGFFVVPAAGLLNPDWDRYACCPASAATGPVKALYKGLKRQPRLGCDAGQPCQRRETTRPDFDSMPRLQNFGETAGKERSFNMMRTGEGWKARGHVRRAIFSAASNLHAYKVSPR